MVKKTDIKQKTVNLGKNTHLHRSIAILSSCLSNSPEAKDRRLPLDRGLVPLGRTKEKDGPKGLEPTRYGDWESKGRCIDF